MDALLGRSPFLYSTDNSPHDISIEGMNFLNEKLTSYPGCFYLKYITVQTYPLPFLRNEIPSWKLHPLFFLSCLLMGSLKFSRKVEQQILVEPSASNTYWANDGVISSMSQYPPSTLTHPHFDDQSPVSAEISPRNSIESIDSLN